MEFYTENLGLLQFLLDKQYHHVVLLLQCEFFPLFSAAESSGCCSRLCLYPVAGDIGSGH